MPRPIALASGVYHLNIRVPKDLAAKLRGVQIELPVAGNRVTAKVGDKVIVSLRTKDSSLAKIRFLETHSALANIWASLRREPKPLTHAQIVALAGDAYRTFVDQRERSIGPDTFHDGEGAHEQVIRSWMVDTVGDDCEGMDPDVADQAQLHPYRKTTPGLTRRQAEFFATLQLPNGPELLAWLHGSDIENDHVTIRHVDALETLFGKQADAVCAQHRIKLDKVSRVALLHEIGRSATLGTGHLKKRANGDFSPDTNLARFPTFAGAEVVTTRTLFERWCEHKTGKIAPSTIRRYTPSINSLAIFLKGKDIRQVSQDDIWEWAEHRRDVESISPGTVNGNDLVAAAAIFTFSTSRDGKRLRTDNPTRAVKLDLPKTKRLREPYFRANEISAILLLARSVRVSRKNPRAAASRRWAPWICAYSGARIQEPCWLEKKHFRQELGIWVVDFPQTKTENRRTVPLHDELIAEGLIDFVLGSPDGFLFVEDGPIERNFKKSLPEQRASELARWIQKHIRLEKGVSPNHGWRHTFITRSNKWMDKRIQNAICGHNERRDASDGYFTATIEEMKEALDRYPSYSI